MEPSLTTAAMEAFPADPDGIAIYPASAQMRVIAALQHDVYAGCRLICVTGPVGSGKTRLLRALRQRFETGLVGLIEQPTSGHVLADVAKALQLEADDENALALRRQMIDQLSALDRQQQPIIQIIDDAHRLTTEDLDSLLYFFSLFRATLILGGVNAPETWLNGCMEYEGGAQIDNLYRLDVLSPDETAAYVRHRLRAARLPEELFRPAELAEIHHQSGGLPGHINRLCAEILAHASVGVAENDAIPAPAPAVGQPGDQPQELSNEVATAEIAPGPEPVDRIKAVSPSYTESTPPGTGARAGTMLPSAHHVRRGVRSWRAVAVLVGIALAVVLIRETGMESLSLDRALLDRLASLLDPPIAERQAQEPVQAKSPATPANPDSAEIPSGQSQDAVQNSDFAALHAPSSQPEDAEAPPLPGMNGPAPSLPQLTSEEQAMSEAAAGAAGELSDANPMNGSHAAPADTRKDGAVQSPLSDAVPESPPLTRAQREEIARLYADRAEYEWRKGELDAVAISIRHGLSSDPSNPRLLEMRALLREVMQEP